ncbi:hypothetical protein RHGRI_013261 [Rhododendron griersonianum]|uniref:Uncharacterized protein n=1 Tax=Rhododendron griersonianum TaxID=479676 RepID=A0AAV6K559_9ERIC|nr:hypothetical protein RHGRI_013261 [Rhododendron griersonianum]
MAERIRVRAGDFSFFLAISLLGAILLPAPIFCFGDIIILSLFPWHDSLSQLLARFLLSIWVLLRGIPLLIITCIVQIHQQNETETNPPPPQVEDVAGHDIERGDNPILPEIGALNITIS